MVEHTTTVQVRWSDADPAGIVFYPRFFEWYDLGTESLFESLGLPWPEMFPHYGLAGVPIVESGARFVVPIRYGDRVAIHSVVAWVKTRTFRMEHDVSVRGVACASGFEIRAWVARPASGTEPPRATPIPPEIAEKLRGAGPAR